MSLRWATVLLALLIAKDLCGPDQLLASDLLKYAIKVWTITSTSTFIDSLSYPNLLSILDLNNISNGA